MNYIKVIGNSVVGFPGSGYTIFVYYLYKNTTKDRDNIYLKDNRQKLPYR